MHKNREDSRYAKQGILVQKHWNLFFDLFLPFFHGRTVTHTMECQALFQPLDTTAWFSAYLLVNWSYLLNWSGLVCPNDLLVLSIRSCLANSCCSNAKLRPRMPVSLVLVVRHEYELYASTLSEWCLGPKVCISSVFSVSRSCSRKQSFN